METKAEVSNLEDISRLVDISSSRPLFFLSILLSIFLVLTFTIIISITSPMFILQLLFIYLISVSVIIFALKSEEYESSVKFVATFISILLVLFLFIVLDPTIPDELFFGLAAASPIIFLKAAPYSIRYIVVEYDDYYTFEKISNFIFNKSVLTHKVDYDTIVEIIVSNFGFNNFIAFNNIGYSVEKIEFSPSNVRGLDILDLVVNLFPLGTRIRANFLGRPIGGIFAPLEPKVKGIDSVFDEFYDLTTIRQFKELNSIRGRRILVPSRKNLFIQMVFGVIFVSFLLPILLILVINGYMGFLNRDSIALYFSITLSVFAIPFLLYVIYLNFINPICLLLGIPFFDEKDDNLLYYFKIGYLKSHQYKVPLSLGPEIVYENQSYSIVCKANDDPYYKLPLLRID